MESNNGTLASDMSCITSYIHKIYLTATQRQILVVFDIAVMALNLLANSVVLIVLLCQEFVRIHHTCCCFI